MENYQKERIDKGIEATQPLIDIIKSYDINSLSNNLPNLFEQVEKKAEENDIRFSRAGINGVSDDEKGYLSFVANLVYEKLLDVGYDGVMILMDCAEILEQDEYVQENKNEKSKIKKLVNSFKFKGDGKEKITEESLQKLNSLLYKYYMHNNYIENYRMEDNVVNVIVEYFKNSIDSRKKDVRDFLVKSHIKEDLTCLGYANLYRNILLDLSNFYKMDLINTPHPSNLNGDEKEYNEVESEIEYIDPSEEEEKQAMEIRKRIIFTKNDNYTEESGKTPDNER